MWNPKKYSNNPQWGKKKEKGMKNRGNKQEKKITKWQTGVPTCQ